MNFLSWLHSQLLEIEITLSSGQTINSTNLELLRKVEKEDFFNFTHVKPPKGLNQAALKVLFMGLIGRDLSQYLKDETTYISLVNAANEGARKAVTLNNKIQGGYSTRGIEIITREQASAYRIKLTAFAGFCDDLQKYTSEAKIKNFRFSTEEVKKILETKPLIEDLDDQLNQIKNFEEDISYLQQARQYLPEGSLKSEISQAVGNLSTVLSDGKEAIILDYQHQLKKLREAYADFYLEQYTTYRISDRDHTLKEALLNSDEKQICDILKKVVILPGAQYESLLRKIDKLEPANENVNKDTILHTPYQDFNPMDYIGQPILEITDLQRDLKELYVQWVLTLKDTMDDPAVKSNLGLLDAPTRELLQDFKNGNVTLGQHNASKISQALTDLYKGLDKVELTTDSLKATFSKPMTPEEAIAAFKAYIDMVSRGKDRDKIRIILK